MPSGQSAGFARGLAGVLQSRTADRRKKESEQADRDFSVNLSMFGTALEHGIDTGDYSASERIFELLNPEQAKQLKKHGGIGTVIAPIVQQAGLQDSAQAGGAGTVEVPGQGGPDGAATPSLPTGAQPPQPVAAARPDFFGMAFGLSPEARRTQAQEEALSQGAVAFDVRRRVAEQLGMEPSSPEWEDFVKYGTRPSGAAGAGGFTLGPGQARFGPEGGEPLAERAPTAQTEKSLDPGSFHAQVVRREEELGRPLRTAEVDELRESFLSQHDDAAADPAVQARARLMARNPQIAQAWTSTMRGDAIAVLEQDPELYLEYETTRSAPMRAMATKMLRSVEALIDVDDEGKTTLSTGGATLWGPQPFERMARFGRAYGREAAASLAQVTSQEVLAEMARMKAQSPTGATGFGQLNMAELDLLIAGATVLLQRGVSDIGEARALKELTAIYTRLQDIAELSDLEVELGEKIDAHAGAAPRGGSASGFQMDADGNIYQDGVLTSPVQ